MYNSNRVHSINHSRDATYLGFNGYRRCRADSCLTEREACERSPVRRLTGKRTSCSMQDLCISSMRTVQITVCKLKPDFGAKPRENVLSRICASLQRKRLFWMTRVQPRTNNLVRFAYVILGMLPFVKLERLTFVDLVTFPFVNLVTLRFVKI